METTKKTVAKKVVKKVVAKKAVPKKSKKYIANEEKFNKLVAQINNKEERGFAFVATLGDGDVKDVAVCADKVKGGKLVGLIATLASMYGLEDDLIKVLLVSKIRG